MIQNRKSISQSTNVTNENKNDKAPEISSDEIKDNKINKDNSKEIDTKQKSTKKKIIRKSKPKVIIKNKTEEGKLDKITKTKAPVDKREIKSSAPIEIMKVDGNTNSEKIKKKGWWST